MIASIVVADAGGEPTERERLSADLNDRPTCAERTAYFAFGTCHVRTSK